MSTAFIPRRNALRDNFYLMQLNHGFKTLAEKDLHCLMCKGFSHHQYQYSMSLTVTAHVHMKLSAFARRPHGFKKPHVELKPCHLI